MLLNVEVHFELSLSDSQPTSVRMDMSILPEANIVLPPKSIWRWQQL